MRLLLYSIVTFWTLLTVATCDDAWYSGERKREGEEKGEGDGEGGRESKGSGGVRETGKGEGGMRERDEGEQEGGKGCSDWNGSQSGKGTESSKREEGLKT